MKSSVTYPCYTISQTTSDEFITVISWLSRRSSIKLATLLCAASLAHFVPAADLYRWTDSEGRVHYGDKVPDDQKAKARPIDQVNAHVGKDAPTSRRDSDPERTINADPLPPFPRPAPRQAPLNTNGDFPKGRSDCQALARKYEESVACFDQYRTANGGIRPEGFQVCKEMKMPDFCQ